MQSVFPHSLACEASMLSSQYLKYPLTESDKELGIVHGIQLVSMLSMLYENIFFYLSDNGTTCHSSFLDVIQDTSSPQKTLMCHRASLSLSCQQEAPEAMDSTISRL